MTWLEIGLCGASLGILTTGDAASSWASAWAANVLALFALLVVALVHVSLR